LERDPIGSDKTLKENASMGKVRRVVRRMGLYLLAITLAGCQVDSFAPSGNTVSPEIEQEPAAVNIGLRARHSATELAAAELAKFFAQLAGRQGAARVDAKSNAGARIEVGLFSDFGLPLEGLDDLKLDDAIHVDVEFSNGIIAGSNPRSVLFAVYRFLEAAGCRWLRPGPDGDYVPSQPIDDLTVRLSDRARYRFRGYAPDGSWGIDHLVNYIAWAPKVGLNTLYMEFFIPRYPYNDYYGREYPSLKPVAPRSDVEVTAYHEMSVREAKQRDLLFHGVGHGWTSKFFGNPEVEGDHRGTLTIPSDETEYLALVNGERLKRGPTTTDLCYGNPEVQRRLAQRVADYAEAHPEVDFLHFWLGDVSNRHCECDLCRNTRPSDLYVLMLNKIDEELTRRGVNTRIVFLMYLDLLWPPEKERLANPDRFALLFCPITRLFDEPYQMPEGEIELPPFRRNQNELPRDIQTNIAFLREWQQGFPGTGFVYDYHMTWHHYYDLGYYGLTKVLAEDIRRVAELGLDGYTSCAVLRAFYPHGFPMYVHSKLLWNPELRVDELAREYFEGAFGKDGSLVREYMETLSD